MKDVYSTEIAAALLFYVFAVGKAGLAIYCSPQGKIQPGLQDLPPLLMPLLAQNPL